MPRLRTPAPAARLPLMLAAAALLALGLPASPVGAHGQTYPLDADQVKIRSDQGPGTTAFDFQSTDADSLIVGHDPAVDGAALLVRGEGANAGRTPLVSLDPSRWAPSADGFQYSDPSGTRGGVTSITFENGELSIQARSEAWGWSPAGPQEAVWVHFRVEDEWYCAAFTPATSTVASNQAGHFEATEAPAPGACPEQVCGNGVHELGEECDDGNLAEGDGCDPDCTIGACNATSFDSTWEGIQQVVLESDAYGCSRAACHDMVEPDGDLDLSHDAAYESLLGVDGQGAAASTGTFKRVLPLEPSESLLFLKLAAKKPGYAGPDVGSAMPTGLSALSDEHLEAVELWIRGGAPRDRVVAGTASLLGTCFPPAQPLKTPVPASPATAEGFQLQQTPYPLSGTVTGQGENEICISTYYDLSARAPAGARVPCPAQYQFQKGCVGGTFESAPAQCQSDADCAPDKSCLPVKNTLNPGNECVAYDRLTVIQDPQSHHSILGVYTGRGDIDDPGWDDEVTPEPAWSYKFEPDDARYEDMNGDPCDPTAVDPTLGYNPGCSSEPQESIACVGYGPRDLGNLNLLQGGGGGNLPQVSLSQEVYYDFDYPPNVYNVIPIKGVMVWNSHAFNLTPTDSTMAQFLNVDWALESERKHSSIELFDAKWIFAQFIRAYQQKEVCATYTIPQGSQLFQLSSHTHRYGVRWRTWAPPNQPCRPACPTMDDDPLLFLLDQFNLCDSESELPLCEGPREDPPIYYSSEYSDPLNLEFDPPLDMRSADEEDRTFLYCSVFDNGSTEDSPPVKRWSTSPKPPDLFGGGPLLEVLGGPCIPPNLACVNEGPQQGQSCFNQALVASYDPTGGRAPGADHAFCDSSPDAGDGDCDACAVHGGVTTEDEMFILLGNYYIPEPGASALGVGALAALGALTRRRRR